MTPATVRHMFAFLLAYAIPSEPRALYKEFIEGMAEDYMRERNLTECTTEVQLCALNDIDQCLRECDQSLTEYMMLPQIPFGWNSNTISNQSKDSLIIDYYSTEERKKFQKKFQNNYDLTWPEQRNIIDYVKRAIDQNIPIYALIDASAGTGKTFIIETLQNYLNSSFGTNAIYISVSSTGISADLLQYGRTAHYTFALPTHVTDLSTIRSQLEFESNRAERFRQATVLFWDEIFTIPRQYIEATDILFQQLKKDMRPFGNLIVLVSGDRKQTLAKIPHGYRAQIVQASFINSPLRSHFTTFTLKKNHRLAAAFPEFAKLLEQIGTGTYPTTPNNTDNVIFPDYLHRCYSMESLVDEIYGISTADKTPQELACRAILTPLNRNVRRLNEYILTNKVPGEIYEFEANDIELDSNNEPVEDVPPEILARLDYPGLPLHTLKIKTGCIVMCLRNLNTKLKNGTKLEVLEIGNHYIKAKILTGSGINQIETIPRISLTQTLQNETCTLRRRQFPLALGYAMTADKSQGQGLTYVGLYLCTDFFAHGQLYTAMSRAKDPTTLSYYIGTDGHALTTKNIVWPEVFN
jgi:PIF1-like helicase